jgi:hypothetical protein
MLAQSTSGLYHCKRAAFSSQLRSKVGNILAKAPALRITLNVDDTPVVSRSHTHPESPITLGNYSFINLVYVFRYYGSSDHLVYTGRVHPSTLAFSLASHRHSNISLLFTSLFIDS